LSIHPTWSRLIDEVRRLAIETLGRELAILALDETSFLKRGQHSAGVAKQYCGTTGRVENCQIGVFLSWITQHGHTLIDCELYLPPCWTENRQRCQEEPTRITFALVFAPQPTPLTHLVMVVGGHWRIEEDLENGKHLGMDHYELRCYRGWYRYLTLILLILAHLTCIRVHENQGLSLREMQHLLARLLFVLPSGVSAVLAWSAWRNWHNKLAAAFHLRRRLKAGERVPFPDHDSSNLPGNSPGVRGISLGIAGTHPFIRVHRSAVGSKRRSLWS
jgi:hypothetical protein